MAPLLLLLSACDAVETSNDCDATHAVKYKETCWSVARVAKVTVAQLRELNPGLDCARLNVGRVLCVAKGPSPVAQRRSAQEAIVKCLAHAPVRAGYTCAGIAKGGGNPDASPPEGGDSPHASPPEGGGNPDASPPEGGGNPDASPPEGGNKDEPPGTDDGQPPAAPTASPSDCLVFGAMCTACSTDGCTQLLSSGPTPFLSDGNLVSLDLGAGHVNFLLASTSPTAANCDAPDVANPQPCTQVFVSKSLVAVMQGDIKNEHTLPLDDSVLGSVFDESCSGGVCMSGAALDDVSLWSSGDSPGSTHNGFCNFDYGRCGYLSHGQCKFTWDGNWVGDAVSSAEQKRAAMRAAWVGAMTASYHGPWGVGGTQYTK
ncbi:hypothetical protein HYH03_014555 [Edaphochlamys debaryana]|uniref:LysM domain-containing protein n=1 Tax=Edaphochlamys debaryana TaxID=47281 RepID=A0A835XR68_9CHLO|nr:hypothetical protein HYH03_014555 [Edaphochlamys debaryana]|eukprot:KAG2486756.1 hypothetical protein HYH03_014555 [Edaphochlamys debaryana]